MLSILRLIISSDGQRFSAARVFLKPTSQRPNFHLKLNALVKKVIIKKIKGQQRAVGIEFLDQNGNLRKVSAKKEVRLF